MDVIRELISPTGKRKVRVYRRVDGFFEYEEIYEAFDEIAGVYWSTGYQSGMFETESAVMSDVGATTPWLRDAE